MVNYGFIGNQTFGQKTDSSNIIEDIVWWMNISFLEIGSYTNVTLDESDYYGNNLSQLSKVEDRVWEYGNVYQSKFKNWVYESGVNYPASATAPTICSGIWIGGEFHKENLASGSLSYHIDFRNGRIIFDTTNGPDIAYGSGDVSVKAEFSYKRIYILDNRDANNYSVISDVLSQPDGSGVVYLTEKEIPLPLITIAEESKEFRPYELGGNKIARMNVICDIYGETMTSRDSLCDILVRQENKRVPTVNWTSAPSPLDGYGDINREFSGVYESKNAFPGKDLYITKAKSMKDRGNLPQGTVIYNIDVYAYL